MAKPEKPKFVSDYKAYLRWLRTKWMKADRDRKRLLRLKKLFNIINNILRDIK